MMYEPTERQHLQEIKLKIENLLLGPPQNKPPLLDHYNDLYSLNCRYKNSKKQGIASPVCLTPKSASASKKGLQGAASKANLAKSNQKYKGNQQTVEHNKTQKKSAQKQIRDSPFFKSAGNGASPPKSKFNATKKSPAAKSKVRKRQEGVSEQAPPNFQQKLEQVKKRFVRLTTLSMKASKERPKWRLHISAAQRQSSEDSSQMKKQLQEELVRYSKAIKENSLSFAERYRALEYLQQVMDKFEYLLN